MGTDIHSDKDKKKKNTTTDFVSDLLQIGDFLTTPSHQSGSTNVSDEQDLDEVARGFIVTDELDGESSGEILGDIGQVLIETVGGVVKALGDTFSDLDI